MTDLISSQDLHDAAEDDRMIPVGSVPTITHAANAAYQLGLEPQAVLHFLRESNFAWPDKHGTPHDLHWPSVAYGICLGMVAQQRLEE